jgi:hypothetical protein
MKVEKAMESVNRVARRSNEPGLRRVSQDLNLVRNSIKLARASMGSTGAGLLVWWLAVNRRAGILCRCCGGGSWGLGSFGVCLQQLWLAVC